MSGTLKINRPAYWVSGPEPLRGCPAAQRGMSQVLLEAADKHANTSAYRAVSTCGRNPDAALRSGLAFAGTPRRILEQAGGN